MRALAGVTFGIVFGVVGVVACSGEPGGFAPGEAEGTTNLLRKPAQPGEQGCGPKINCDDGNVCTADSCVRGEGCVHTPLVGTACNDGSACTQVDTCVAGTCTGTDPIVCTAQNACHAAGTCDPATGACSNPTATDGAACDDGNACTQTDTCQAGTCTGANPIACTASDQCHVAGTCDPATGQCSNPDTPWGIGCNDGNACTPIDVCENGACVGVTSVTCAAIDPCHSAGTCDPSTGTCSNPASQPASGYYVAQDGSCSPCACHSPGSQSTACDANGACTCRRGYTGAKCDGLTAAWDLSVDPSTTTIIWDQSQGNDAWIIPVTLENLGQNAVSAWTSCQLGGAYFAPSEAVTIQPGTILGPPGNTNRARFVGPRGAMPAGSPQVATCSVTSFITPGVNDQDTTDKSAQVTLNFPSQPTYTSQADLALLFLGPFQCSSLVSLDSYQYSPPVAGQATCLDLYISVSNVAPAWQLSCTVDGVTQTVPGLSGNFSYYYEGPANHGFNVGVLGSGAHTISCTVDSGNAVVESNEANNTMTKTITL